RHTRFSRDWSSDVCSSDLDGFDKSRYDIVMLFAGFVIQDRILLRQFEYRIIRDNDFLAGSCVDDKLKNVQEFPAVATGKSYQRLSLTQIDFTRFQESISFDGAL